MEEAQEKIKIYPYPVIYSSSQHFSCAKELREKLYGDRKILDKHRTKDNYKAYLQNWLVYHLLVVNGTNWNGVLAEKSLEYQKDGWFIWLQNFEFYVPGVEFKNNDEKFTYYFDKYFDYEFLPISRYGAKYWLEAMNNYKDGQYYSCVCGLFPLIEYFQKQISKFDGKSIFNIKKSLEGSQVKDLSGYKAYFEKFESNLNGFLTKNIYAVSTEADEEPEFICRNRVLHGIFTRRISNTDCLKLFCIVSSMTQFASWLFSIRKIKELAAKLEALDGEN